MRPVGRGLRSPKDYTGPDLGLPSLGYQAWHEAVYGPAHWQSLDQITRKDWAAYLIWVRQTIGPDICNDTEVVDISPAREGHVQASCPPVNLLAVRFADGTTRHARNVVLATGQDGGGLWWMPDFVAALPPAYRAHAADLIDFSALRGQRVAVLGAGASALDNAERAGSRALS